MEYLVSVDEEHPIRDACAAGRIVIAVDHSTILAESVQLGRESMPISDLAPGPVTITIQWFSAPDFGGEEEDGQDGVVDKEERERGENDHKTSVCSQTSMRIWVVVAEVQLVQRPWGAVAGTN